jgi:hypothetical protein
VGKGGALVEVGISGVVGLPGGLPGALPPTSHMQRYVLMCSSRPALRTKVEKRTAVT